MPKRAIQYWRQLRNDDNESYAGVLARNLFARANAFATLHSTPNPEHDTNSASAQDEISLAQYAQFRHKLMQYAAAPAHNLILDDAPPPRPRNRNPRSTGAVPHNSVGATLGSPALVSPPRPPRSPRCQQPVFSQHQNGATSGWQHYKRRTQAHPEKRSAT